MKDDCSKHKREVAGIDDMNKLAEMIGDLHYETLAEFILQLARKINADSVKDTNAGRKQLGMELFVASCGLENVYEAIKSAWQISKPFMSNSEQGVERSVATDAESGNKS